MVSLQAAPPSATSCFPMSRPVCLPRESVSLDQLLRLGPLTRNPSSMRSTLPAKSVASWLLLISGTCWGPLQSSRCTDGPTPGQSLKVKRFFFQLDGISPWSSIPMLPAASSVSKHMKPSGPTWTQTSAKGSNNIFPHVSDNTL